MRRIALVPLVLLAGCGGAQQRSERGPLMTPTPAFSRAGTLTATPKAPPRGRYLTARVKHPTWLRAKPNGRVLHKLMPRTEFGSRMVLAVVGIRGRWARVISAQIPNHRRAWVPLRRVRLQGTGYDIVVDRSQHRARLRHNGRTLLRFAVAVGAPGTATPLGHFAVTDKLAPTDPTSPYGCCALALSAHQPNLEPGWVGGDRVAIHGTPQPWTIGKAISHGCMRASSKALHVLLRRVPLGAPVWVRA